MFNKKCLISFLLAVVSFGLWIYGNSIEHGNMSNAGFQVFGALGTVFFTFVLIVSCYFHDLMAAFFHINGIVKRGNDQ